MNIVFRVDANEFIGTGHLMRCIALAQELKAKSFFVQFVCRDLPDYLVDMLITEDISLVNLKTHLPLKDFDEANYFNWLRVSVLTDVRDTINAIKNILWDWLIIDHYAIDKKWEVYLKPHTRKILVIDDLENRQHISDILIDQNYYPDQLQRYNKIIPSDTKKLLGPSFALLRRDFFNFRKNVKIRDGEIKKIVIFFGGVDRKNLTFKTIKVINKFYPDAFSVDVVIGSGHEDLLNIVNFCANNNQFKAYVQPKNIHELYSAADFSVGAGGISLWERCCLGLPTLTIATENNQIQQISNASQYGYIYNIKFGNNYESILHKKISFLIKEPSQLNKMSKLSFKEIDGKGIFRAVNEMLSLDVKIKKASILDSELIFKWRNHPQIRKWAKNSDAISWNTHKKWFNSIVLEKKSVILLGLLKDTPIGVVRFDFFERIAKLSIFLDPELKFRGQGCNLLFLTEKWLKNKMPEINEIRAEVLKENKKSINFFLKCNYKKSYNVFTKNI